MVFNPITFILYFFLFSTSNAFNRSISSFCFLISSLRVAVSLFSPPLSCAISASNSFIFASKFAIVSISMTDLSNNLLTVSFKSAISASFLSISNCRVLYKSFFSSMSSSNLCSLSDNSRSISANSCSLSINICLRLFNSSFLSSISFLSSASPLFNFSSLNSSVNFSNSSNNFIFSSNSSIFSLRSASAKTGFRLLP